jgi:hypothetical protein
MDWNDTIEKKHMFRKHVVNTQSHKIWISLDQQIMWALGVNKYGFVLVDNFSRFNRYSFLVTIWSLHQIQLIYQEGQKWVWI